LLAILAGPVVAQDLPKLGKLAAELRGLSYQPVTAQVVSQKECSAYLLKLLDAELEPRKTRVQEGFLQLLGLLGERQSMKAVLSELYTDQVRGLYDPARKRYLVVKGGMASGEEAQAEAMAAAMGMSMTDMLTVHELGHAIQDQHFNLTRISKSVADDADKSFAAQTLLEGDASVLMLDFAARSMGLDPAALAGALDPSSMATGGGSGALARAPRYFRELLSLPYTQGMVFVSALKRRGGWKAVDQAYASLPASSEQVLHPEKYLRDPPRSVSLAKYPQQLGRYKALGEDTAGEFTVKMLEGGDVAAAGWGGDRYRVYVDGAKECAVWETVWDSEKDAREFEALAKRLRKARVERERDRVTVWLGDIPQ